MNDSCPNCGKPGESAETICRQCRDTADVAHIRTILRSGLVRPNGVSGKYGILSDGNAELVVANFAKWVKRIRRGKA